MLSIAFVYYLLRNRLRVAQECLQLRVGFKYLSHCGLGEVNELPFGLVEPHDLVSLSDRLMLLLLLVLPVNVGLLHTLTGLH